MSTRERGPVKMNRAALAVRDGRLIKMYLAGTKPTRLAECFEIKEATVFSILKRHNVTTASMRVKTGADLSPYRDADANALVMSGFCRCPERATEYLRRADYFQQNPHLFKLHEIGITPAKLAAANQKLAEIKAHVTGGVPFYVYFATRNAFMTLTFRELVKFISNPYVYLLTHKECIVDAPGAILGDGGTPRTVGIAELGGI